ncbi:MAG: YggS family pyridoxal phosphate-dependent enzyme [Bacteroidales bacterium]|nr:YggS family pyridoxal phosphate-dependent enzyme [Bacteroidales bacterium]
MIKDNLDSVKSSLPSGVKLVAVSKTKPLEDLLEAYDAGQKAFGENYPLELRDKHEALPKDIEWHFIGHIQSKQIKYYIDFVTLIHGVDSAAHLADIDRAAAKACRVVDVLLEFHIATEETKSGFTMAEAEEMLAGLKDYPNVRVVGVMGMATNTPDTEQVRSEFRKLHSIFDTLKQRWFAADEAFKELSMGMSHDYAEAVAEGSTIVRVGSKIFGARNYQKIAENK